MTGQTVSHSEEPSELTGYLFRYVTYQHCLCYTCPDKFKMTRDRKFIFDLALVDSMFFKNKLTLRRHYGKKPEIKTLFGKTGNRVHRIALYMWY